MGKKKQKKKSERAIKTWAVSALTDLIIGIILLILDKLLNQLERGESPSLKKNITQNPICVNMLWKLGIFFIAIGVVKLIYALVLKVRDSHAKG